MSAIDSGLTVQSLLRHPDLDAAVSLQGWLNMYVLSEGGVHPLPLKMTPALLLTQIEAGIEFFRTTAFQAMPYRIMAKAEIAARKVHGANVQRGSEDANQTCSPDSGSRPDRSGKKA